jgi:hypothetical protein
MWQRIKQFFKDSEVIFWARLQVLLGVIASVITYVDPSVLAPIMPAEWSPLLLVAHGIALEYLRRRRDKEM